MIDKMPDKGPELNQLFDEGSQHPDQEDLKKAAEFATFMHIVIESEKEETDTSGTSINSTYHGEDYNDDVEDVLNDASLDLFDLELMDDDERAEIFEDAGLDVSDYDF